MAENSAVVLSFPRVLEVAPGEPVASRSINNLADAINQRIRSGYGDCAYRIHYFFANLWRQVRRPAGEFVFPAQLEFMQYYVLLEPESAISWPTAPPGEDEGANLANPMMAFVYGNPGVASESNRTEIPMWVNNVTPPQTEDDLWYNAAQQRGLYDPGTDLQNAPAFEASQDYYRIAFKQGGMHGQSYGGYLPAPELLGYCNDETEDLPASPNRRLFFTPLKEGLPLKVYAGTCPNEPTHVGFIARTPFAYYIIFNDGRVERLAKKDYLEGPYSEGGYVSKTDGEHLTRCLNLYIKDYRGSLDQREDLDTNKTTIEEIGFDFENFFNSQYFLSPNLAAVDGTGQLNALYPTFSFGTGAANVLASRFGGGTSHGYRTGFVLGGFYAGAQSITEPVTIEVLNYGQVFDSFTLTPEQPRVVRYYPDAGERPAPNISFRRTTAQSAGKVSIQCTEQLEYKPEIHDAYLLLRLSSSQDQEQTAFPDGSGLYREDAVELGQNYFRWGMILNNATAKLPAEDRIDGLGSVTSNPVFDAARRFTKNCVRVATRQQLVAYAVENNKSVLYFNRYALGNSWMDSFEGIAPDPDPIESGKIMPGILYQVRSATGTGTVRYAGIDFPPGTMITGIEGETEYESTDTALPFEFAPIRHTAPPRGTTNQWVMFSQFKAYSHAEESQWKPDAYADFWGFNERCQFASPEINKFNNPDLLMHFQGTDDIRARPFAPEAPTGWRYANGTNSQIRGGRFEPERFFKSCRIYEPPVEIETCELVPGGDVIKITFKQRLHHNAELAPAGLSADINTWDLEALRQEAAAYRTDENAIREYLVKQAFGTHCTKNTPGDAAAISPIYFEPDDPWGTCFPHFFFTKLVEKFPEDNNDDHDSEFDTISSVDVMMRAEWYLRAFCEGWIDGKSSETLGCKLGGAPLLYDYVYDNLALEASGTRWQLLMPQELRPDLPQGFGALPNTIYRAENHFNHLARCLNLLTRARVMLPLQFMVRETTLQTTTPSGVDWPVGSTCSGGVNRGIRFGVGGVQPAPVGDPGEWTPATAFSASVSMALYPFSCDGSDWNLVSSGSDADYRIDLLNEAQRYALPPGVAALIEIGGTGVWAYYEETELSVKARVVTPAEAEPCDYASQTDTPFFHDGTTGYAFDQVVSSTPKSCRLVTSGKLSAGSAPASDVYVGHNIAGGDHYCGLGSSRSISIEAVGDAVTGFLNVPLV